MEVLELSATLLGTGTSTGVPVVGCDCEVCTSEDPRDRRLRCSVLIDACLPGQPPLQFLIDTSTDLRQQALAHGVHRVDAILFTHAHADHIFGLDEVRVFNFRQGAAIPCFGSKETLERIRRTFAYVFEEGQEGGGKPNLDLREIDGAFRCLGVDIVPVPVLHGSLEVLGFRIGPFAYVTDCSRIPAASLDLLRGVEVLVLGALRYRPHPTHFSISQALEVVEELGPKQTYFTHLTHEVRHGAPEVDFPEGVAFGYDGLRIRLS